jgi:glutamyl-tRNA synthetase
MSRPVRFRIAPSPTGDPHVGTAYMALFNLAFARHSGPDGRFVLRIEDTDRNRYNPDSERQINESLDWLGRKPHEGPGIGGDFGPYRQSERVEAGLYRPYIDQLVDKGAAYRCFCTSERLAEMRAFQQKAGGASGYDRKCRGLDPADAKKRADAGEECVVRLAMPLDGETAFDDLIRGRIAQPNKEMDDQVLMKSDGYPTYHLANVVDDHLMEITHVIRAEEWVASTPKHVVMYEAFGWEQPRFVHMPLLRNDDRSKISKRKNPVSLLHFRNAGYLPEALVNYLGQMGYSMKDASGTNIREKYTFDEMVAEFDWSRVSTGAPVFDPVKLNALNGDYIRELPPAVYIRRAADHVAYRLGPVANLMQERSAQLGDFVEQAAFLLLHAVDPSPVELKPKKKTATEAIAALKPLVADLGALVEWTPAALEALIEKEHFEKRLSPEGWKKGDLYMLLRVAVSGKKASPPLFDSIAAVGSFFTRQRLEEAMRRLEPLARAEKDEKKDDKKAAPPA